MKRRVFLFSAAVFLGTACLLSGCGKKSATGNAGEVYVYNWGEYIDESVITMFEEETGIKVVYDMFETNEEMYPVIEAGGVNYDVICPSDYMIQKMIENDLLAELNFDNIPNISEIDPEFMERSKAFDPENKYSVPYTWGTVGILYNTSMVAPEDVPTRWTDLWDEKFKGEILMQDSVRDKMNFEYITYATPNRGAFNLLDEEIQNIKAVFPDIDSLENSEVFQYLGDDVDSIYNDLWKEVKSN